MKASTIYRPLFKVCYELLVAILLYLDRCKDLYYTFAGQILTAYYFFFFFVLVPVVGGVESALAHYKETQINEEESSNKNYTVVKTRFGDD